MGEVQITDIAIPAIFDKEIENKSNDVYLAKYCPPEIDNQLIGINYKCDIWSLGVLFFELSKKKHPFDASTGDKVVEQISKGSERNDLSVGVIDNIIRGCFKLKPNLRPSLANIKKNISNLYDKDDDHNEVVGVRRASYGLASPNNKINNDENNTEKLDEDSNNNPQKNEEYPSSEKYFSIIDKLAFASDISSEIVYNRKREEELTKLNNKYCKSK